VEAAGTAATLCEIYWACQYPSYLLNCLGWPPPLVDRSRLGSSRGVGGKTYGFPRGNTGGIQDLTVPPARVPESAVKFYECEVGPDGGRGRPDSLQEWPVRPLRHGSPVAWVISELS
jgi:hypothetical protein